MPSVFELESLRNFGTYFPAVYAEFNAGCAPTCTVLTCSCTSSGLYWSSTTYRNTTSDAWNVLFSDGDTYSNGKTGAIHVRAVRGGA